MADYTINEIENTIVEALTEAMPYLKSVFTYGGVTKITTWYTASVERAVRNMPCVFVEYRGTDSSSFTFDSDIVSYKFAVVAIARNLPTESEGRKRTNNIYDMLEDIRNTLMDKTLGLDLVTPIVFGAERPNYYLKVPELSTYEAVYTVSFVREGVSCGS